MIGLRLPKRKHMSLSKKLNAYTAPEKVYIPLISSGDTDIVPLVKKGDYIFKGQVLGRRKGNFRTPVFSSVSGIVSDFKLVDHQNKKKVNAVVIDNDYKEKIDAKQIIRKDLNKLSKEEFLEIIENCGIIGMGGAGFPTYVKYNTDKKINTLLVNAVECEPYITADYTLINEKCEELLETIDAILDINDINEAIIAIKVTNTEIIESLRKYMGSYLKIKIAEVPNRYPMGWERTLIKQVKKFTYDRLPIEKGIVVNNISTIYAISQALKFNKPLIERVVTFTGEGLNKPQNILVKVGTPVTEIINFIGGKKKDTIMVAGGPMMGNVADDDLVVTADLNCVLVLPDGDEKIRKECLRCGKCITVCPVKICPVLIKDNINNIDSLKEYRPERCIECGLCSYVCPSKIELRDFVKAGKFKINERR